MFALFHFLFELLKIGLLSSVYALIILLFAIAISKLSKTNALNHLLESKLKFWKTTVKVIYGVLFIFMFTYWGDHGLGDDAYLPVGHFQVVNQSDGMYAYVENQRGNQLSVTNFIFDDNNLYAEAGKDMFGKIAGDYLVWDLKNNTWKFYTTSQYLNSSYPIPSTFYSFNAQYDKYWNIWRFWLLP
jgi:hypothetical protein